MILVTGAGGAAGVAVIRALRERGNVVGAVDADPLAAGLALATDGAVIPPASDEGFVDGLCDVVKRFDVDAVVCTVSEEMVVLADATERLGAQGAAIWLS